MVKLFLSKKRIFTTITAIYRASLKYETAVERTHVIKNSEPVHSYTFHLEKD